MPQQRRVAIVGGGIVGTAIARELLRRGRVSSLTLLEKKSELALAQSSHNSGVVHAGIYYSPGSHRAKLCVKGMAMMKEFCEKKELPFVQCGKLIAATDPEEFGRLDSLFSRARDNGADVAFLGTPEEVDAVEPAAEGGVLRAIWSPRTAVADFGAVTSAMAEDVAALGGEIRTNFELSAVRRGDGGATVLEASDGGSDLPHVEADFVITACGVQADRVARLFGGAHEPAIVAFQGSYRRLTPEAANRVSTNIYPVPDPRLPFLGVHVTPTVHGDIILGPTALPRPVLFAGREPDGSVADVARDLADALRQPALWRLGAQHAGFGINEMGRELSRKAFAASLKRFLPWLTKDHVDKEFSFAGIRAQAIDKSGLVEDFAFDSPSHNVLCVRNAPSPACTSSLAIAEEVADRAETQFKFYEK